MSKRKMIALLTALALLCGTVGGCGDSATFFEFQSAYSDVTGMTLWGESAQMSYDVPQSVPNIVVNQTGYQLGSRKMAVFKGAEPGESFRVVDASTGEVLYEAQLLEKGWDAASGALVSYGTFTDFDREGTYYVETAKIGRSYTFPIGGDVYAGIFDETYRSLLAEQESWNMQERCYVLGTLMTSYALYPEMYAGDGDGNRIPDLLDFAREQTALLMENKEPVTPPMTAVLAQFSGLYKEYDKAISAECLRNAKAAYDILIKNKEQLDGEELYAAASQLYCNTGAREYHNKVQEYLSTAFGTAHGGLGLYADVAYLSTKYTVNLELCRELMKRHMDRAEQIAQAAHEQTYLICQEPSGGNMQTLLDGMVELAFVDYVITNHEYANVMENHLHYFLGRNPDAASFVSGFGTAAGEARQDVLGSAGTHAEFVFMMSAVMNHHVKLKQ